MFQCPFLLLPRSHHQQHLQGPSGFCVQCHEAHWVFMSFSASIQVQPTSRFKGVLACFSSFLTAAPHLGASPTRWTRVVQVLGAEGGQASLACCGPWGHKEPDVTERLDWTGLDWAPCLLSGSVPVIYC